MEENIFPCENSQLKLNLRNEELEIVNEWVKTGDVNIRREVSTKEKTITVSVNCEELVIENTLMNSENPESDGQTKVIRIPLSEERIEVVKHPVKLEDVTIYEQQYQVIEHIKRTLKSEKIKVETCGAAKVIDTSTMKQ